MIMLDALALGSLAGFALLSLVSIGAAPKRDLEDPRARAWLACVILGTALAYLAGSPWLFVAGWVVSSAPAVFDSALNPATRVVHLLSAAALALGFAWPAESPTGFLLLALAVVFRKGIVPFHFWVPAAFARGSLPALSLMLNGHLGAYLMIRYAAPIFPDSAGQYLSLLGILALTTSVLCSLLALAARQPRRILGLLCTSQAAFILAGLANRNVEGITGALLHWWVVAFATATLLAVYRALESRTTEAADPGGLLGYGFHAPRLAVFFAMAALALAGLPGTLGFAAEDLLFHGALESHPQLGIALPLATALNAITALRLLATLFLGRRGIHVPRIADALPRERWALTLPIALLVAGGVFPAFAIALRMPVAEQLANLLRG